MPFSSKAIANELLDIAKEHGENLSPMKLQKLAYYAQGWHLALRGTALISEQVGAWEYGPVFGSLYHEFKEFGNNEITRKAVKGIEVNGCWKASEPSIDDDTCNPSITATVKEKEYAKAFLNKIWDSYGSYTAVQLSNQTHLPDRPWRIALDEYQKNNTKVFGGLVPKGADISTDTIKNCFDKMLEEGSIW